MVSCPPQHAAQKTRIPLGDEVTPAKNSWKSFSESIKIASLAELCGMVDQLNLLEQESVAP